ncbi:hypothetical protein GCM10029964_031700 [Kibdelosporangium lantanae]
MYYPPQQQQQAYQQPQPTGPRPSAGVLVGVSLWRAAIVASAIVGFSAALARSSADAALPALSQQASLLAAIVYTGLLLYPLFVGGRRHEPKSPWWRGVMVVLLLLVCVTFITIMGGSLNKTWSLFEHLITPMLVLVDFLAVGRNQVAVKWWHPITWTAFPLAYLIYYVSAGLHMYGSFLNPKKSSFAGTVAGFVVGVLFVGFLLFLFGMMKASATGQRPPRRQQQPYPGYPQYGQYQQPYPQQPQAPQQFQPQYPPSGPQQQLYVPPPNDPPPPGYPPTR